MAAALSAGFCRHSSLDLQVLSMAMSGRGLESVWRSRLNQSYANDFHVTCSCAETSMSAAQSRFEQTNDDQLQGNVQYRRYTGINTFEPE